MLVMEVVHTACPLLPVLPLAAVTASLSISVQPIKRLHKMYYNIRNTWFWIIKLHNLSSQSKGCIKCITTSQIHGFEL
jgi:hypothetical protein